MRVLAIGDIHGYADVLRRLLDEVRLESDDELITVGDYVDRGPDSRGVLDFLIPFHENGQLTAIRGNHDFMMLNARKDYGALFEWKLCGGAETLNSYGDDASVKDIPDRHWSFLENDLVDWYEIDSHFFVHAQVDPDLPLVDQPLYLLHWEALYEAHAHCSGKIMVCGHTKQKSGLPRNWGHSVCIDTWVYGDGWLTCLDIHSERYWQANKHGETRTGTLPFPE